MQKVAEAKKFIVEETQKQLEITTKQWGVQVYVGAKNKPKSGKSININATKGENALLTGLQTLGYKVPKITKKDVEGNYEAKESTSELALQKMLITNQFQHAGGDPAIRAILSIREMEKLRSSYFGCNIYTNSQQESLYLTNYNCVGTLSGRRSSRKHTFGFGNNAQNFPSHGQLAKVFRKCLKARDGNIFLMVDAKGAELWPVYALANDTEAMHGLKTGVNMHIKRSSGVFQIPIDSRSEKEWKSSIEYYLGKKIGHALNYGMKGSRMSESLAQEGKSFPPAMCQQLLDRANSLQPKIQGVFHKYIQKELNTTRILKTPFGRERQFFGLRQNDANYKIFNEAYSYIPQSTVGDNTGFAVAYLEDDYSLPASIVQEGHDSIVQDVQADLDVLWANLQRTVAAFNRVVRMPSTGIEFNIPVEAKIGFNFADAIEIPEPLTFDNLKSAFEELTH